MHLYLLVFFNICGLDADRFLNPKHPLTCLWLSTIHKQSSECCYNYHHGPTVVYSWLLLPTRLDLIRINLRSFLTVLTRDVDFVYNLFTSTFIAIVLDTACSNGSVGVFYSLPLSNLETDFPLFFSFSCQLHSQQQFSEKLLLISDLPTQFPIWASCYRLLLSISFLTVGIHAVLFLFSLCCPFFL